MMDTATTVTSRPSRLRRFVGSIKRHLEAVRIARELGETSDRQLADMGIARGDVDTIAYKRYGRS